MSFATKSILFGALAGVTLGHGYVPGIVADGTYTGTFLIDYYYEYANGGDPPQTPGWYAENLDLGFVEPSAYNSPDIACHINAVNANSSATVSAGGDVSFQWTDWPHNIGPVLTYVANCGGDCSTVDKTALEWVKIDEGGYDTESQTWASQDLIDNNNTWTTTVPSTLAAGQYVFRHEIIALHGAGSENGAQNYPQCINIEITGSGTDSPAGTVATELYKADDAGILFNPYTTITDYPIPGPKLYGSGSGSSQGGANSGNGTSAGSSPAAVSSAAPATSTAPDSTSSALQSSAPAIAPPAAAAETSATSACRKKMARRHPRDVQL